MAKSDIKPSVISTVGKSRSRSRSAWKSAGSFRHGERGETSVKSSIKVWRNDPQLGKTDWAAVDALTDEEIEQAVRRDPDAVPLDFDWSKAVLVMPPRKKAISIRVDEDVLDYFKKAGAAHGKEIFDDIPNFTKAQAVVQINDRAM